MQEIPKDVKKRLFMASAKSLALMAALSEALGCISLILGIISDAMDKTLGLQPEVWVGLAIAFWIYGFWSWVAGYFGAKEG